MRFIASFVTATLAVTALVACGDASVVEPSAEAQAVAAAAPSDAFTKSLLGSWSYLELADSYRAFATLTLRADGSYDATGVVGLAGGLEKGRFTTKASAHTLTLTPSRGAKRAYTVEVGEGSAISLARNGKTTVLQASEAAPCESTGTCPKPPTEPVTGFCPDRRGGALVTFDVAGEPLAVWSTNADFIAEAKALVASGDRRTPMFDAFLDGSDCDTRYTWHVDPAKMSFTDFAVEICDGTPSYLESHKASWAKQVNYYCPWGPKVTKVEER